MKNALSQLPRCYAPPRCWGENGVSLPKDETHHLTNVLRGSVGDEVRVFDGLSREVVAVLGETDDFGCARLRIQRELEISANELRIELVQAVPKKGRMEMVLQKATELGVSAIQPVITERTIVRLDEDKRIKKEKRWKKILIGAAKQCKISAIPQLKPTCQFKRFLDERDPGSPMLICSLEESARPLKRVLEGFEDIASITVLIGPEGDFSADEYSAAIAGGAIPVSLGDRVLRTDTASAYILSVLNYERHLMLHFCRRNAT